VDDWANFSCINNRYRPRVSGKLTYVTFQNFQKSISHSLTQLLIHVRGLNISVA